MGNARPHLTAPDLMGEDVARWRLWSGHLWRSSHWSRMQEKPSFAQRLASLRSARKLNQVELAEATGLGKTTINKWENGETEPVLSSIRRLAEFFGCTADYLCGLTEHQTQYPSGFWMVDRRPARRRCRSWTPAGRVPTKQRWCTHEP